MKIYAKQVPPEFQESPLFEDIDGLDGIEIFGNRNYNRHTSALFDRLPDILDELSDAWDDLASGAPAYYESWIDALQDIAPPVDRPEYTREERKKTWPALLDDWNGERGRTLCRALELITGRAWDSCTLRGNCQGDWQDCVFRVDLWNGAALERLESEYFNTGTEWIVHGGDDVPDGPDDIDGFSVYCIAWNDDGIKKEIAEAYGGAPVDVVLYKFNGYRRIAEYTEV